MDFRTELKKRTESFDSRLKQWFNEQKTDPAVLFSEELFEAMEYSMLAGGKRLRPILLMTSYAVFHGERSDAVNPDMEREPSSWWEAPVSFSLALEMIHTHSLVHDDLPAIDNDELRRGLPTTHARYGEALALLAGDALLNEAFQVAATARGTEQIKDGNRRILRALAILADKTGARGMLGGQAEDVRNEKNGVTGVTLEHLNEIYIHKTSALLEAALMIGAVLGGADRDAEEKMEKIGRGLGLAFQIRDDILDVTSDTETLGKPVCSDMKNGKTTYVTLLGVDGAARETERITREVLGQIDELPGEPGFLREMALYLAGRIN